MESWMRSNFSTSCANGLMKKGLLCKRTAKNEWRYLGREDVPQPDDRYVVSFAHFHEMGFMTPPSLFFHRLLHYYGLELQHLNPNGIHHIVAFVTLCEGYLGVEPKFSLWKYFFTVSLYQKTEKKGIQVRAVSVPMGCTGIHLRRNRSKDYMVMKTTVSHKGWNQQWFYVKNYPESPLPEFTSCVIAAAPDHWSYGPVQREKKHITGLLQAIDHLKEEGLTGARVIGVYHARRVARLMLRACALGDMVPGAVTECWRDALEAIIEMMIFHLYP